MEILIGIIIGVFIGAILFRHRPMGNLRVDHSDLTGEPYLFLELDTDVGSVMRKKYATFKIRVENFLPHE